MKAKALPWSYGFDICRGKKEVEERMNKISTLAPIFLVLIIGFSLVGKLNISKAQQPSITINSDGTITPSTAPIKQTGNDYTLTDDVVDEIWVRTSNVVIDGNGFTEKNLIYVYDESNVTIQNFGTHGTGSNNVGLQDASNVSVINNTLTGYDLPWYETSSISVNNGSSLVIIGNTITNGDFGIMLVGSQDSLIVGNNITGMSTIWQHESGGIMLSNSSNNLVYHNNFFNDSNGVLVEGFSSGNSLDDGYPNWGNYWDDSVNQLGDRYPLSEPFTTTPPNILLLSPTNQTYDNSRLSLVFAASTKPYWAGYSLDGEQNVTITGNSTIANFTDGFHNLTVYANDTFGNMGSSQIINFYIAFPTAEPTLPSSPSPSHMSSPSPTLTVIPNVIPTESPTQQQAVSPSAYPKVNVDHFLGWIPYTIILVIAAVIIAGVVYFYKKRERPNRAFPLLGCPTPQVIYEMFYQVLL